MWESGIITLCHITSFSPFCVSVLNSAVATKWCHKESLLVFSFFTFLMIRDAVCPPSAASSAAQESKGQQGEKKLLQIQLRVPWYPKIGTCHLRNRLLPTKICLLPVQPHVWLKSRGTTAVGGCQFMMCTPKQRHGEAEGVWWRNAQSW